MDEVQQVMELERTQRFLTLFHRAKLTYHDDGTRLAAEGWDTPWQVLISTIMSAQNRDESTIVTAEALFDKYPDLESLASAEFEDVYEVLSSINYNKSKSDYVITSAQRLVETYGGSVPNDIDELLTLKGVGRKTANLVLSEVFEEPAICVDTHVHRLANVFDLVNADKRDGSEGSTEKQLQTVAPEDFWRHINRYFVLWGQHVPGEDKARLLSALEPLPNCFSLGADPLYLPEDV